MLKHNVASNPNNEFTATFSDIPAFNSQEGTRGDFSK